MHVVLPSNSSMDYFPDNSLANYKVKLSKPLLLQGRYEVALVEIIYPHRRLTVEPDEAKFVIYTTTPVEYEVREDDFKTHVVTGIRNTNIRGKRNIKKNATKLKRKATLKMTKKDMIDMVDDETKLKPLNAVASTTIPKKAREKPKKKNRVSLLALPAGMYERPEEIAQRLNTLDKNIQVSFSGTTNKFQIELGSDVTRVDLSRRLAQLLGFVKEPERYTIKGPEIAQFMPHMEGNAHALYIYSSIVDHQIVGDTMAPLLRVVCPDAEKLGQTVSEKYIKPYYLPVNSSFIDTIDIQIRTTSGHLFPFQSGNPVVISLHFRPQRNG